MQMIISAKLSMMSGLCAPFITNCSITDVLYDMNIQHTHKHLVCSTLVRLCFRHVVTRHAIMHQVLGSNMPSVDYIVWQGAGGIACTAYHVGKSWKLIIRKPAHSQNLFCYFTPVLICQTGKGLCYNKGRPDSAALWIFTSGHESAAPRHLSPRHTCLCYISAVKALHGLCLLNAVGGVLLKGLVIRHGNLRSNLLR